MGLEIYHKKRDFRRTPEPRGKVSKTGRRRFVCQEHHASSLHFDFRLEAGGVLKSWSLRKGPSMDPAVRRLAVPTEGHPVEYLEFEGDIPKGNYGAGQHRIWDSGTYKLIGEDNAEEAIAKGKLKLELNGRKLKGVFNFFRLGQRDQWLLVKSNDEHAKKGWKLELLIPDKDGRRFIEEDDVESKKRPSRMPSATTKQSDKVTKKPAKVAEGEILPTVSALLRRKSLKGDLRVNVDGFALDLTSLDRVYWPDEGYTKADLIRYYFRIANHILPYLENRPLILKRFPSGIQGKSFHQHDVDEVPEFVETVRLQAEDGGSHLVDYVVGGGLAAHLYLANLGAIERHPWHSRTDALDRPDWIVFDLDPGTDVEFETICEVALSARAVLAELGLDSYAKTSGSRGMHVYVPIQRNYSYEVIADVAAEVAKLVADENPETATVERSKQKRKSNQIYVDHLQNAYGKSVVAPYSVRPRPGAAVSAPLEWSEVEKLRIATQDFTIFNMLDRIKKKGDLFAPVLTNKQGLDIAMKALKIKPSKAK